LARKGAPAFLDVLAEVAGEQNYLALWHTATTGAAEPRAPALTPWRGAARLERTA
jgi:hypothetical protein